MAGREAQEKILEDVGDEALCEECLGYSVALWRVVIFGCWGMALVGYNTGIVSGAMPLIREDVKLDTRQAQIVVSITLLTAAVSTVVGIPFNSLYGRRQVIVTAALVYIAGSVFIACARGFGFLVAGRALVGVAIGFASGTVPMYSAELSPSALRGVVVTLNDLNVVVGQLLASGMNVVFKDFACGWRWSMGLAAAPAAVLFVGFFFLPESPRWLAMSGHVAEAEKVLQLVHNRRDVSGPLRDILSAIDREGAKPALGVGVAGSIRMGLDQLSAIWCSKQTRRAALLGIGLMAMNQFSGINTVMCYSTTILIHAGFSRDASIWLAALCGATQLVGVFVSVASMDSLGRRPTALRSTLGAVVTLIALALSFWCKGAFWDDIKVAALMLYLVAFGSGLSGVPWVMNSEIYPLHLRSAAVGQATVSCWIFNFFVGRYFLSVCEVLGTGGAFSIFAAFSVVGGIWMYFMLPETKGLELEAIGSLFEDPYPRAWGGAGASSSNGSTESSETVSDESWWYQGRKAAGRDEERSLAEE